MRACAGHMGLDRYDLQLECQRLLFCPVWHLPMASIIIKCMVLVHNTRRIQGGTAMATASCCLFGMSYLQGYSLERIDRDDPDTWLPPADYWPRTHVATSGTARSFPCAAFTIAIVLHGTNDRTESEVVSRPRDRRRRNGVKLSVSRYSLMLTHCASGWLG